MKIKDFSDAFKSRVKNKIDDNMLRVTEQYTEDLKETLDVPPARSGRVYRNIKGRDLHVASAPGEPPAPLTRQLIESIRYRMEYSQGNSITSYSYSDKGYAKTLEFGSNKIKPRPAWKRTILENKDEYASMITEGFKRRHTI